MKRLKQINLRMKKYILTVIKTVLLLILFSNNAFSQDAPTMQGKEFLVTVGANTLNATPHIRMVATKRTNITFTYNINNSLNRTFIIEAGEVYTHTLSSQETDAVTQRTQISSTNRTLRIESNEDLSVFVINANRASTDATGLLPVSHYGTEYFILSYRAHTGSQDGYIVIANEDNTQISENGVVLGTLDRGFARTVYVNNGDITGRKITSDKPVAVFTSNFGARVPAGLADSDCLYQQLLPVSSWGTRFLVPVTNPIHPNVNRNRERIRIIASQDGTTITQVGGTVRTDVSGASTNLNNLNNGQFVELEANIADKGCYIVADKPIAVGSFLMANTYFHNNIMFGDPSMAWIPPIEQTLTSAAIAPFFVSSNLYDEQHYALIVTPTATKEYTRVTVGAGGNRIPLYGGEWIDNAASGFSFYQMRFSETNKDDAYYFDNPAGFSIMGAGFGSAESYYYLAAAAARTLDASFYINDIHNQDAGVFCDNSFSFRAEVNFPMSTATGRLRWYINGIEALYARDALQFNTTLTVGTHNIRMAALSDEDEVIEKQATITVASSMTAGAIGSNQSITSGATASTLTSSTLASGGSGAITYQWQSSTDNTPSSWVDIAGATNGSSYSPGALTSTTYYRRAATTACGTVYTNSIQITVMAIGGDIITANGMTICSGSVANLSATASSVTSPVFRWYNAQTGGTLLSTGATYNPSPSSTTTYYVSVQGASQSESSRKAVTVTVSSAMTPGSISGAQSLCFGGTASTLTSSSAASGGTGITYRWQSSPNGTAWTDIAGSTGSGASYSPGAVANTTHYRRTATGTDCNGSGSTVNSNVVIVTVTPAVNAGSIGGGGQNICSGSAAATLTSTTAASGGSGTITYNWQQSTNGTTWTNATNTRTNPTYSPGTLTATTHYRRQAVNSCGTVESNTVIVTVASALVPGSIGNAQTICSGGTASTLTSTTAASGGTGTITYRWQSSPNGTSWTDITGTTGANATYSPGSVATTTHYRRRATGIDCNGSSNTVTSNVIIITVAENISAGAIGSNQSICAGNTAATLTSTTAASGGTSALTYRWQSSTNGTSWTDITGTAAANATYSPGVVSTTTHYRRNVTGTNCNGSTATVSSNAVIVTVTAAISAGSIGGSGQNICAGDIPNTLTSTTNASGGTGTLTYRWQSSPNGTSWTDIAGATGANSTYSPGAISATTHYRRTVTGMNCGGSNATVNSNVIVVTVSPLAPPTMIKIQ